jgi:hypothetical protein
MARASGRNGYIYLDQSSAATGSASPWSYVKSWKLSQATDTQEVTSFGDTTKVYVQGLPDASGSFDGFLSLGTAGFQYLSSGARKMYLYPDATGTPGTYWFGTINCSTDFEGDVGDVLKVSVSWTAASSIGLVGSL